MNKFFKKPDKAKQFAKVTAGVSEEAKRQAEMTLLKPTKNPKYTGEMPDHKCDLDKLAVTVLFPNKKAMRMASKFVFIGKSFKGEQYITDIGLFLAVFKAIKKGKIKYVHGKIKICKGAN